MCTYYHLTNMMDKIQKYVLIVLPIQIFTTINNKNIYFHQVPWQCCLSEWIFPQSLPITYIKSNIKWRETAVTQNYAWLILCVQYLQRVQLYRNITKRNLMSIPGNISLNLTLWAFFHEHPEHKMCCIN